MIIGGSKPNTIRRYLFSLKAFSKFIVGSLEAQKDEQIYAAIISLMQSSNYNARTKEDIKMAIKRYYKYSGRYLSLPYNRQLPSTITKEDLLDQQDITNMLAVAPLRDKAIIQLLWETGIRPQELLTMNVTSVNFKTGEISVNGKTGPRTIPITDLSLRFLGEYISVFPRLFHSGKLWLPNPKSNHQGVLSEFGVLKSLRKIAASAAISKTITIYLFRHSAATRDAVTMPEVILRQKYGWAKSSRMPEVYVHLAARDLRQFIDDSRKKEKLLEQLAELKLRMSAVEAKIR